MVAGHKKETQMKEHLYRLAGEYLLDSEVKAKRATLRERVLFWFGVACLVVLGGVATGAYATPLFQAEAEGVKIVVYDEPCKIDAVANLKYRATWHEKGKVFEGCVGGHPQFPIVMGYFADKTVVVLPAEMFVKVTGA
jgi:hypothetical protein